MAYFLSKGVGEFFQLLDVGGDLKYPLDRSRYDGISQATRNHRFHFPN